MIPWDQNAELNANIKYRKILLKVFTLLNRLNLPWRLCNAALIHLPTPNTILAALSPICQSDRAFGKWFLPKRFGLDLVRFWTGRRKEKRKRKRTRRQRKKRKESKIPSLHFSTTTSEIFTYSVCANQPPPTTQLVAPQSGSIFQRCNISTELTWDPYYETDFGVVCEGISQNSLTVQISQDPNFGTTDQSIEAVVLAGSTLLSFSDLQPLTIYFWRLNASNGILFTFSNVFNFTTPDLNTPACSGNGYCSFGQCVCNADYVGLQCQSLNGSNTITPSGTAAFNPDSNPSSGGEIAGTSILKKNFFYHSIKFILNPFFFLS